MIPKLLQILEECLMKSATVIAVASWQRLWKNKRWIKLSALYNCFGAGRLCILCNQSATLSPGQSNLQH